MRAVPSPVPCRGTPRTGYAQNCGDCDREPIISTSTHGTAAPPPAGEAFDLVQRNQDRAGADPHTEPILLPGLVHPPVTVDASWRGHHGIGRFSAEVLRRIKMPRRFVTSKASPTSPVDVVAPWRLRLTRRDVVFTPGFNAGPTAARQILTLHDLIHLEDGDEASVAKRFYYERLVRPAVRRAGAVLTVSATSRRAIEEWLGDDEVDVVDVGNGCSEQFFRPSTAARSDHDFLYVGNLKPHKNPASVFAAMKLVPDARLTVVSSDAEGVRRLSVANGIAERVHLVANPSDEQLRDLYAGSTALLLPSLREGFGLPAVESLAAGTPVLHWRGCDSVKEIVGPHGIAVDSPADATAWAEGMEAAMGGHIHTGRPEGWWDRWAWDRVARRVDRAVRKVALS